MKVRHFALVVAACGAWPAAAQTIAIEHQPVGCIVAENFPDLSACFQPGSEVARARLQFRAAGTIHWYYVEMQPGGACYSAVLPKPKKSTKGIEYYIDVSARSYGENRTPDYRPRIASGLGGCKRRGLVAAFVTTAAVRVFAQAGAPVVPAGFSAAGVTTAAAVATGPGAAGAAGGAGGGAETSPTSQAKSGKPAKVGSGGGGGGGAAVLGVLAVGAAGAGVYLATKEDPAEKDDDGDGVSEKDGDCDDTNKDVSPNGGFGFTVDYSWTGAHACSASNPRAQVYRVTNRSCTPLTLRSLTLTLSGSGACQIAASSKTLPLSVTTVAPGATTTIRTGPAAGTAQNLCCPTQRCTPGTCAVSEQYTLATSAGNATATNAFAITDTTGASCPSCDRAPDWPLAPADGGPSWAAPETSR